MLSYFTHSNFKQKNKRKKKLKLFLKIVFYIGLIMAVCQCLLEDLNIPYVNKYNHFSPNFYPPLIIS